MLSIIRDIFLYKKTREHEVTRAKTGSNTSREHQQENLLAGYRETIVF
jgi:hypothetical protein